MARSSRSTATSRGPPTIGVPDSMRLTAADSMKRHEEVSLRVAVECAAVGEVDLGVLDSHIRALEARITEVEARLWPRVVRRVSRFAARRRG